MKVKMLAAPINPSDINSIQGNNSPTHTYIHSIMYAELSTYIICKSEVMTQNE